MGKMVPVEEVFWCFWFFVASRACLVNNVCWVVPWRESSWYPFMNEFLNSNLFCEGKLAFCILGDLPVNLVYCVLGSI